MLLPDSFLRLLRTPALGTPLLLAIACSTGAIDESPLRCGEGTTEKDGACVPLQDSPDGRSDGGASPDDKDPDTKSVASGGSSSTGGDASTGGDVGTGGDASTGGDVGTGGDASTGGDPGTGGLTSLGGSPSGIPENWETPCYSRAECGEGWCSGDNICIQCRMNADCESGEFCEAGLCMTGTECTNTHDCSPQTICDQTANVCVFCTGEADCASGELCVANYCKSECDSDNDCRSSGELCRQATHCAQCNKHGDCPANQFCDGTGTCRADHCGESDLACVASAVSRYGCSESGSGYEPFAACRVSCEDGCYAAGETTPCPASCTAWSSYTYAMYPAYGDCVIASTGKKYAFWGGNGYYVDLDCGPPEDAFSYCPPYSANVFIDCAE